MISYEAHPLAGNNIEERRERIERSAARNRAKNRGDGVPDMEPERHEPVEWFAEIGYHSILEEIGRSQPDYDWSDELDSEKRCAQAKTDYLAARKRDRERVIDYLRGAKIAPIPNRNGAAFGPRRLMWVDRIPGLKTWGGQQSLAKILVARQTAMTGEISDLMTFEAPLSGASGFDRRVAAAHTAIDTGFSGDALAMASATCVALELLAAIGLETVAITCQPDGSFVYEAGGKRWRFQTEARNGYYRRWTGSADALTSIGGDAY